MRKLFACIVATILLVAGAGCGNLSPRVDPKLDQKIDNQEGRIRDMESIQNGIKNELGNIKQNAEIQNSKLDRVQQGLFNFQKDDSNTGIQILSGPGGIFLGMCGIILMVFVVLTYRNQAIQNAKAAELMAERIVKADDPLLEDDIFNAAMYSDVEEKVYGLIKKHQLKQRSPSEMR